MNAVSSLWQQKITAIGREHSRKFRDPYLFFIIFVSSIDLIQCVVCVDDCKHIPSPCELKLCPVMLCLDLVRFAAFFLLPLAALIMSIRIAWQQEESQNIYRIY